MVVLNIWKAFCVLLPVIFTLYVELTYFSNYITKYKAFFSSPSIYIETGKKA